MIVIHSILEAEMNLEGILAVVFDLDDTLYSEKDYVHSGFHAVAGAFPDVVDMEKKLWDAFLSCLRPIDRVLMDEGLDTKENKRLALQTYRLHEPAISLYPGAAEMLKRLSTARKTGIITDGRPEGQRAKIRALGLNKLVDEIIVTDELGGVEYRKPNTKAFSVMQARMNIPFSAMAYVGDNGKKDFTAPEELGMRCLWFKNIDGLYYLERCLEEK